MIAAPFLVSKVGNPGVAKIDLSYLFRIATTAALGGLLVGYDWVVIGGAKHFYELYFHLSSEWLIGWASSCALLGCVFGSLMAGVLSDHLGRRGVLIASAVLFAISSVLTGWAHVFSTFIHWRIAGGVAIGLASNAAPMYIAEISSASSRGRLVSLNQLAIVVGVLLAQIVNWLIADVIGNSNDAWNAAQGWRWMFTAPAVPAIIFFLLGIYLPESPRWLCMKGRVAEAREVLRRIGGRTYAFAQTAAILSPAGVAGVSRIPAAGSWKILFAPGARRRTLLTCMLAVLQQGCGVNILFNYANEIYRASGYHIGQVMFPIVIADTINLVASLLAMTLIDRCGRRALAIFGFAGVGCAHLLAALVYARNFTGTPLLLLTLTAMACYASSLAPVTWVLLTELFPTPLRGKGVSLAVSCFWMASFLITYGFPALSRSLNLSMTFFLSAFVCLAGLVLISTCVPETYGRSLEELGLHGA